MAWFVRPLQRKDSGRWRLIASSDEDGGFHEACEDHDHATADEASTCEPGQILAGQITGFPYRGEKPIEEPYFVELDTNGCIHCGHGRMWRIVGPDGSALSISYADDEDATWLAEQLNTAYEVGKREARRG